jgi:hypothetical protein
MSLQQVDLAVVNAVLACRVLVDVREARHSG